MEFRDLKADEIDVRVAQITKDWLILLLYKDARVDMNILDETLGSTNWQRDHKELKGNIYCGVSIWDTEKKQWITKWDAGAESYTEKEKGEASDSFKRACVNLGIGRELYTTPTIFIPRYAEQDGKQIELFEIKDNSGKISTKTRFNVEAIEITNKVITGLAIKNNKGIRVFVYKKQKEVK